MKVRVPIDVLRNPHSLINMSPERFEKHSLMLDKKRYRRLIIAVIRHKHTSLSSLEKIENYAAKLWSKDVAQFEKSKIKKAQKKRKRKKA